MSARALAVIGRLVLLTLVVGVLVACDDGEGGRPPTRVTHPRTPDTAIIDVTAGGGIAPPELRVSDTLPEVWLGGDGRYLAPARGGASTSALAPLTERRLTEPAIQELLQHARRAGLLEPDADYGSPEIFDAVNTRIVVVANGRRHDVLVEALGYPVTDLDDATVAARAAVSRFLDVLTHPGALPGARAAEPSSPTEIAVFVLGPATGGNEAAPWPLGDLATLGTATEWPTETTRCLVVSGADVSTLRAVAANTPRTAPWQSGGARWQVALRPLLPDEHGCADVVP